MAQVFVVNVYEINGSPVKAPLSIGFPSAQCQFSAYTGNNYNVLYGIITSGINNSNYATVETPTVLVAKANA